ncbi:MAG TPA: hypothetical protein VM577_07155 [Anaerovoracaceae bacterium]|nr:hypothetical protein [Anaerovoracaceae bacterium]
MSYSVRFQEFQAALTKNVPDLTIKYKNESFLMQLLGKIMFFNPAFMTDFVTTIGHTVYFPTKAMTEVEDPNAICVLAHEYRHMRDSKKWGSILFTLAYLFPQLLAPLALLLILVSWPVAIAVFVMLLAPWPAPGRKAIEYNGYCMSLFMYNYFLKELNYNEADRQSNLMQTVDVLDSYFTSFDYYLMWPFGVKDEMLAVLQDILSEDIVKKDVIYSEVEEALASSK